MQKTISPTFLGVPLRASILFFFAICIAGGIVSGFAVGQIGKKGAPNSLHPILTPPVVQVSPHADPTTSIASIPLGPPNFQGDYTLNEVADNNTVYEVTIQAVDQTKQATPISASGITCKLWLVQHLPAYLDLSPAISQITSVSLQASITGVVQGVSYPEVPGMIFNPDTPQVQSTNTQGQVIWKYRLSSSIPTTTGYDLVALVDWGGKSFEYNWAWKDIAITGS